MKKLLAIVGLTSVLSGSAVGGVAADIFPEDPFLLVTFVPPVNIPVPWDARAEDTRFNDYFVRGVAVSLVYSSCPSVYGLGVGCALWNRVDMMGLQCGGWGATQTGFGAQICALAYSASDFGGSQFGLYCGCGGCLRGTQTGIFNQAERLSGVQIGLVNVCEDLKGVQIGLVNVNRLGRYPVLPVLNARF